MFDSTTFKPTLNRNNAGQVGLFAFPDVFPSVSGELTSPGGINQRKTK
jgi:hypothetical protein